MPDFTVNYATGSNLYITAERLSDATLHTIVLTDNADGTYTGDMASSAGLGQYICRVYKRLGASPAPATDRLLHPGEMRIWSGSAWDFDAAVKAAQGTYNSMMTFRGLRNPG